MASLWAFILANKETLLVLAVAIVNEVFAANPSLKSNSLLQFLLGLVGLQPKALSGK